MFRFLYILLFCFPFISHSQTIQPVYEFQHPDVVSQNSSFDVSLITSNTNVSAEELRLYIRFSSSIDIKSAVLRYENSSEILNLVRTNDKRFYNQPYLLVIYFDDEYLSEGNFFQLLFDFKTYISSSASVEFYGEFLTGDSVVSKISKNINSSEPENSFIKLPLKFYELPKLNGKCALLKEGGSLKLQPKSEFSKNIAISFWSKFDEGNTGFIKVKNSKFDLTLFDLSLNEFQIVTLKENSEEKTFNPVFLSTNVWYYFTIHLKDDVIDVYIDEKPIGTIDLTNKFSLQDLHLILLNDGSDSFCIDHLRVTDLMNKQKPEAVFSNKKFEKFYSENSENIIEINFENLNSSLKNEKFDVKLNKIKYAQSDAPIFQRAPKLNVRTMNSFYELQWFSRNNNNAQSYVVERSTSDGGFIEVNKIQAIGDSLKNYTFLDEIVERTGVIFYRIKQLNKNGTTVYSAQVKIGQGESPNFVLNQNYPNPFNPKTSIEVELLNESEVEIIVYNLGGQEVARVFDGSLFKGVHKFEFDAAELPSGIYLYKVSTPNYTQTRKMILAK